MSIIKFRKIRELFPNRKVRIVRTEQLCQKVVAVFRYHGVDVALTLIKILRMDRLWGKEEVLRPVRIIRTNLCLESSTSTMTEHHSVAMPCGWHRYALYPESFLLRYHAVYGHRK